MRKNKKPQARIKYYKEYPPFGEGYAVELFIDDSWELETFYVLQRCIVDDLESERNFVHYSILTHLQKLQQYGYEIKIL